MSSAPSPIRKFDLYDFFSVYLPGLAFIAAIAPFLPAGTNFGDSAAILVFLLGGFIVGRGIHSVAVKIEDLFETIPTHRERFQQEISLPEFLSQSTVDLFRSEYEEAFGSGWFDTGEDGDDEATSKEGGSNVVEEDVYSMVRSYVHIDGRGRSRSFQAIYAFHRGMWVVTVTVALIYYSYAWAVELNLLNNVVGYMSVIGTLHPEPVFITLGSSALFFFGHYVFRGAREDYQQYYIQYLISDFLVLQSVDYPEAVVMAEQLPEIENDSEENN